VSDQGFDFGPPPSKREARPFEPPPWERDQFEQHRRELAEREAAAQAARDQVLAEQEAARLVEQGVAVSAAAETDGAQPEAAGENDEVPAAAVPRAEVDEKQVALLMLGLRAEEPRALEGAWVVNLAAGAVVAMVGFASGIWGAIALSKRGMPVAGTLGAFVLLAFGLGFLGVGGWLIFKALRQRGVL
jgi:hypothetical protein